jgi:hypothetical protein
MIRTFSILFLAVVCLGALGCPGKTTKTGEGSKTGSAAGGSAKADEPGGSTPEDLWKKMKAVEGDGGKIDMGKMASLCTKASQTELVGFGIMAAGFAAMGKNMKADPAKEKLLEALLDKHGVKRGKDKKIDMKKKDAFDGIKDKPALVADLFAFSDEHGSGKSSNKGVGEMKEIKTEGDRATVSVVKKDKDGKEEPDVCVFLKEDGRWFFDLAETKKAVKALKASK